jgi:hypothetical protein
MSSNLPCILIAQPIIKFTRVFKHVDIIALQIPADSPDRIFVGDDDVVTSDVFIILFQQETRSLRFNGQVSDDKVANKNRRSRPWSWNGSLIPGMAAGTMNVQGINTPGAAPKKTRTTLCVDPMGHKAADIFVPDKKAPKIRLP